MLPNPSEDNSRGPAHFASRPSSALFRGMVWRRGGATTGFVLQRVMCKNGTVAGEGD